MIKPYIYKTIAALKVHGLCWTLKKIIYKLSHRSHHASWDYAGWLERYGTVRDSDVIEMKDGLAEFKYLPTFSVVIPVYNTNHTYLRHALDSVLSQTYPYYEVCIVDDASTDKEVAAILQEYCQKDNKIKLIFRKSNGGICAASNSALEIASGEYVAFVDHDDILSSEALFTICHYINRLNNEVDLLYSDEDKLDEKGVRCDPYFKGGWNRRMIFQQNYVAHLGVYRRSIVNEIGGFREGFEGSQDYDMLLRFIKRTKDDRIIHVPHVLYSWRKNVKNSSFSSQYQNRADIAAKRALEEFFDGKALVIPRERLCGCWRVVKQGNDRTMPLVSIIIPTRDNAGILKKCIQSILKKTDYSNIEIIVVDNGSIEKRTHQYLKELSKKQKIEILRDDNQFNYSHLNNIAVAQARGEYVLFLNNDVIVKNSEWLTNMVGIATEKGVGAVGAKLLYSNGTIQHAGVVTGIYEVAGHLYRHARNINEVYFGMLFLERNVSAVTGACMLVSKNVFLEVGGFDEGNLAVSFNDIDLCVKIRDAGYDVVFSPDATLYHLESWSRGSDVTKEQKERNYSERRFMLQKYGQKLLNDPFYSPVLSLTNENGNLADCPRVGKPWRDWVEFVCPFHRGDVLLGLQVAYTAAKHGIKVRMHVSKSLIHWLDDFDYGDNVKLEPVEIDIPTADQTPEFLRAAMDMVALREDSSGRIICSHPVRNLDEMGIDLVENMLRQFGLPIDTKLINVGVKQCSAERKEELGKILGNPPAKTILLHPYGGWLLKCMSPENAGTIIGMCHNAGYKVVQIGGEADPTITEVDLRLHDNLRLSDWAFLFKHAHAVIGIDSWTAHFASIVNANQTIVYGSTNDRDVGSKRHLANCSGRCIVVPADCDCAPCNSLVCKYGGKYCAGMRIDYTKDII